MKAITKALVVAMLVFVALVPAMAFIPTIPSSVEKTGIGLTGADAQIASDSASYLYTRTVVDAQGNFQPQDAYSAVEFGAAQEATEGITTAPYDEFGGVDFTGGEVANAITTSATFPGTNNWNGANSITRQYVAQGGTASMGTVACRHTSYDCEFMVINSWRAL